MTLIQNTEAQPDGTPISEVLVEVRIFGPTPAAMSSGTSSVVGTAFTRLNSSGYWSLDLTPNASILPEGTCYAFIRFYAPSPGGPGQRTTEYAIVPPNTVPVNFSTIVVISPTTAPFTDSELFCHLNALDPHPQYLTRAEADGLYG